jgi:hypothetical protein
MITSLIRDKNRYLVKLTGDQEVEERNRKAVAFCFEPSRSRGC